MIFTRMWNACLPPSWQCVRTLEAANSSQFLVRAVDLGFGFAGVGTAGDEHYLSLQSKHWPPLGLNATQKGLPFPETEYYSNGGLPWRGTTRAFTIGAATGTERLGDHAMSGE